MYGMLLLLTIPIDASINRTVDRIELNHVMDDGRSVRFTQHIFWRWEGRPNDKWTCVDWRLATKTGHIRRERGKFVLCWREYGRLIRVESGLYDETWTVNDPEIDDRNDWPECRRHKLRR